MDNQNVEELENYAVYKSEETTKTVDNCLKIVEGIRDDATKTLVTLHQQGEQIRRTHDEAVHIDYDLSRVWLSYFCSLPLRSSVYRRYPVLSSRSLEHLKL